MPYASIKITREPKATAEQRATLIGLVTEAIVETLDKDPETTFVVIEEIDSDSWGVGGEPVSVRRARAPGRSRSSADRAAVADVVRSYFSALHAGDVAALREVFHPDARLVGYAPTSPMEPAVPDSPSVRPLDIYLQAVAARSSPMQRGEAMQSGILSIMLDGPIAIVRASVPMLGFSYIDHLSLARENNRWRITHKQFVHVGAAG
jgi:4-oxalocrotonate tautomerase